jgi:hypothetical protein
MFLFLFQEAISHLQQLEEDLVESHHGVIQNMQHWVQEDSQLIAMTHEVDYDQDGTRTYHYALCSVCVLQFLHSK